MVFELTDDLVFPDPRMGEPDGLIAIGGDLSEELSNLNRWHELTDISDYFSEPYFETKKILYIKNYLMTLTA